MLSAKGAAFNLEPWGDAPGFMESRNPSVESAFQLWPSAKAEMKRAFSARIRADEFPWGDAQALNNATPLALNANEISSSAYAGGFAPTALSHFSLGYHPRN